ncbi:MAG TPA: hypothetical protein VEK82_00590 [Stellaceae bacterium]|nr:hypothetical protein [Stellaceae bacterium]
MLKALAVGIAIGVGITGAEAALAQTARKPAPAEIPRLLLVDDKHKDKQGKHLNKRGDEDEDRDEDDNRGRRSSGRTSRGSANPSQGYYGYSPYSGAPRGYGYYDQPYYDYYPAPYYQGYGR